MIRIAHPAARRDASMTEALRQLLSEEEARPTAAREAEVLAKSLPFAESRAGSRRCLQSAT